MKQAIEAKQKQAEEQLVAWRQKLAEVQEQCIRWDAAIQVCRELLAVDVPLVMRENETPSD